jgi:2-polyprenyl-3-methyl-5-hydroxy-6-metoxy-1,4-benzoquinol methylase
MSDCAVCGSSDVTSVFESARPRSLTSLCTIEHRATEVFACRVCGHCQTAPVIDTAHYYATAYDILVDSDDEDQLCQPINGPPVFRFDLQAATLINKITLDHGAVVLDYGAAKGTTLRKVRERRPDLDLHLFDVSDRYVPFWERFARHDRWATFTVPEHWHGRFDLVTSFFVLEHIIDPLRAVRAVRELLKPGGHYYVIVPDVIANRGDLVVVDHVNHFTKPSLMQLSAQAGMVVEEIDYLSHHQALIVVLRRDDVRPSSPPSEQDIATSMAQIELIAQYWASVNNRVLAMEQRLDGRPAAIYGAGFYGSYLFNHLVDPEVVTTFVDRNPYLQGRRHFNRDVVAPGDLDGAITDVLVGLNPIAAHRAVEDIAEWSNRPLRFEFL